MIDFKPPKKYRVTGKDGSVYEGYIAPGCIIDQYDMDTGKYSTKVVFNLYLDEPYLNNIASSIGRTSYYNPKVIPITDALEYIESIEEIEY